MSRKPKRVEKSNDNIKVEKKEEKSYIVKDKEKQNTIQSAWRLIFKNSSWV
jgi:hypothetical protein